MIKENYEYTYKNDKKMDEIKPKFNRAALNQSISLYDSFFIE